MYREKSPYSGQYEYLNGQTCFGYVVEVDPDLRRARVKTMGKRGVTDDLDLPNVQWINLSSHPDGDDTSVMPRTGCYAVIMFINSEPFIVGYYRPLVDSSITEIPNVSPLLPGDSGLSTIAGNSIIARSGGSVEITSTELCKTLYIPSGNLINHVAQNYELDVDGGTEFFTADSNSGAVLWERYVYDNTTTANLVDVQIGTTDTGALLHFYSGPTDDNLDVPVKNCDVQVMVDGTTTVNVGQGQMIFTVTPNGQVAIGNSGVELLKTIYELFKQLGTIQVLSPVGPCGPVNQADLWQDNVVPVMKQLQSITGSV